MALGPPRPSWWGCPQPRCRAGCSGTSWGGHGAQLSPHNPPWGSSCPPAPPLLLMAWGSLAPAAPSAPPAPSSAAPGGCSPPPQHPQPSPKRGAPFPRRGCQGLPVYCQMSGRSGLHQTNATEAVSERGATGRGGAGTGRGDGHRDVGTDTGEGLSRSLPPHPLPPSPAHPLPRCRTPPSPCWGPPRPPRPRVPEEPRPHGGCVCVCVCRGGSRARGSEGGRRCWHYCYGRREQRDPPHAQITVSKSVVFSLGGSGARSLASASGVRYSRWWWPQIGVVRSCQRCGDGMGSAPGPPRWGWHGAAPHPQGWGGHGVRLEWGRGGNGVGRGVRGARG